MATMVPANSDKPLGWLGANRVAPSQGQNQEHIQRPGRVLHKGQTSPRSSSQPSIMTPVAVNANRSSVP